MRFATLMSAAAALALGGCGGGSDHNADTNGTEANGSAQQQPGNSAAAAALPAGVKVANKEEYGDYLVDAEGRSLYVLEGSRQSGQGAGGRQCNAECLTQWPAFTGGAPSSAGGAGQPQASEPITFAGWPLYYYTSDRNPGSAAGQGYSDKFGTWHLLSPQGEPIQGRTLGPAGGE